MDEGDNTFWDATTSPPAKSSMLTKNKTAIEMNSLLTAVKRIKQCTKLTLEYVFVQASLAWIVVTGRAKHGRIGYTCIGGKHIDERDGLDCALGGWFSGIHSTGSVGKVLTVETVKRGVSCDGIWGMSS